MHQRHVISLLIHGFLSVNARLLIAFGTAFYAITCISNRMYINLISVCLVKIDLQVYMYCTSFTAVIAELLIELHYF